MSSKNAIMKTNRLLIVIYIGKAKACKFGQIFRVPEVIHITCNMGVRDSLDVYALSPRACGPRAYISDKCLAPILQPLHMLYVAAYFSYIVFYCGYAYCMYLCTYVYVFCTCIVFLCTLTWKNGFAECQSLKK